MLTFVKETRKKNQYSGTYETEKGLLSHIIDVMTSHFSYTSHVMNNKACIHMLETRSPSYIALTRITWTYQISESEDSVFFSLTQFVKIFARSLTHNVDLGY